MHGEVLNTSFSKIEEETLITFYDNKPCFIEFLLPFTLSEEFLKKSKKVKWKDMKLSDRKLYLILKHQYYQNLIKSKNEKVSERETEFLKIDKEVAELQQRILETNSMIEKNRKEKAKKSQNISNEIERYKNIQRDIEDKLLKVEKINEKYATADLSMIICKLELNKSNLADKIQICEHLLGEYEDKISKLNSYIDAYKVGD